MEKPICQCEYGIAGKTLKELSKKAAFHEFLQGMRDCGVGKPTQRRTLGIVSAILDQAVEQDLMKHNPIRG